MKRRELLKSVGAASTAVVAGCLNVPTRDQPTPETHTVTITREVIGPGPSATRRLHLEDDGSITVTVTCPGADESLVATGVISRTNWMSFKQYILKTNIDSLGGEYHCTGDCPRDGPLTRLTITIDGREFTITIEAAAEVPRRLAEIQSRIDVLGEKLDRPTCD